jgi:hypothetical protein
MSDYVNDVYKKSFIKNSRSSSMLAMLSSSTTPGTNVIKTFYDCDYFRSVEATRVEPLMALHTEGLASNIRLGWK